MSAGSLKLRKGQPFFRRCPIVSSVIKSTDAENNTVDAMVSTINPDRYCEIVVPSAFAKRLGSYLRNPVHLWAHNPRKLKNVIGKALQVEAVPGGFQATFQYAVDENKQAKKALNLINAGYLNAYSVGFFLHEWISPKDLDRYPDVKKELEGVDLTDVELIFIDVELFEISLCAVPANRESLVVGRSAEGGATELARALAEILGPLVAGKSTGQRTEAEKAIAPAATTKAGRKISADNAKCVRGALEGLRLAVQHLEVLEQQLPEDDDPDEDDPDELDEDEELDDDEELE